jgi:hypothetical protein
MILRVPELKRIVVLLLLSNDLTANGDKDSHTLFRAWAEVLRFLGAWSIKARRVRPVE